MPSDDFIDVRIIADDSPLTEYPDPEAGDDKGHTRTRYVEAKTGQSFGVQIKYQPGFDFEGAPYVYYRLYLDDCSAYFERAISMFGHSHSNGVLLSEIDRLNSSACLKDDATGEWKAHPFGFGVLGLSKVFLVSFHCWTTLWDAMADLTKMTQLLQPVSIRKK